MTASENPIRVLLADDHPVFRAGLHVTLSDEPDIVVVGEAATGDEVISRCVALLPDVLLLDLRMPGPPAEEMVASIRLNWSLIRIVILTAFDDALRVRELVRHGAVGYVVKDEPPSSIVEAIRAVMHGGMWFSLTITERLATDTSAQLTERERELLQLMAIGLRTAEIAKRLCLGEQTTRNYLSNLYGKLDVSNRTTAVAWAREQGLI